MDSNCLVAPYYKQMVHAYNECMHYTKKCYITKKSWNITHILIKTPRAVSFYETKSVCRDIFCGHLLEYIDGAATLTC